MNLALRLFLVFVFPVGLMAQKKPAKLVKSKKPATLKTTALATPVAKPLRLWYDAPAQYFEETLVLGNGQQGATVFGGISTEKIYLNDLTLWSGEPADPYMNKDAYKHLPEVREALNQRNYKKATEKIKKIQGKFSESYAPLGTLFLDFNDEPYILDYKRELDIDQALAKVQVETNNNIIQREYLVSNPDKIFAIHLTSKKAGGLNFTIRFESLLMHETKSVNNKLQVNGVAPVKADPGYVQKTRNAIIFDKKRGTRFTTDIQIKTTTGKTSSTDSTISLIGATEAIVYVSMATSFNGFDKDPAKNGVNDVALAQSQLNRAMQLSWTELKNRHVQDYQSFFNRVSLKLEATEASDLPTNERLKRYAKGEVDPYLEALYFQFGRYLLISSSRTPGVPANLQGIWNPYLQPPWSSNYTMNINAEENYWLAENTNLSELHQPFLQFLNNLATTGKVTAKTFYNLPGWVAHHNSDIWAMSNPVGNFGNGDPAWANWPMGGTWASAHLWEHYLFTQDLSFLKQKAYPLMRGAAEFCLAYLISDSAGQLITSPSTSPENYFINQTGYRGAVSFGGTADLAMIRELFLDVVAAQKILKNDTLFVAKINTALNNLHPYQIGRKGNLQEWYYDWEDAEPKHRHQSHLYGLYPGTHVTVAKTPLIAAAAKKTLEIKGDETTGWSKGWRINLWARLKDGEHAYKMYRELLKYVAPDDTKENVTKSGGTYPNLLDAHPPFQIDGNFGGAAAVAEMLVQSNEQFIELLPAIPKAWASGSVKGLKARGNYEIEMTWTNGQVTKLVIKSATNPTANVLMNGKMQVVNTIK